MKRSNLLICACGCGRKFKPRTNLKHKRQRGRARKYFSKYCAHKAATAQRQEYAQRHRAPSYYAFG